MLVAWQTSDAGLSDAEVARRLRQYGSNLLPEKGPTPLWQVVLRQFVSPLIYILVVAAVVSALIGDIQDAAFIAAVLVLNAAIGAGQECDIQVLVLHDLVGMTFGRQPRFVRQYASVRDVMTGAIHNWTKDVKSGAYPSDEESYGLTDETKKEMAAS